MGCDLGGSGFSGRGWLSLGGNQLGGCILQSRFLWCELVVVCLGFMFQFGIPMVVAGVWCFKGGVGCVSMISSYFGWVFWWMVAINLGVLVVGFWCFNGG